MDIYRGWQFVGFLMLLVPGIAGLCVLFINDLTADRNNRYLRWELIGRFLAAIAAVYAWYLIAFTLLLKR